MMNQHTTASTCDTYRSAEATSRCGIARNQFTSGRQFAIRSGGSKANAAGYEPPIACMDHLRCRADPTGDRTRLARKPSTYSINDSQLRTARTSPAAVPKCTLCRTHGSAAESACARAELSASASGHAHTWRVADRNAPKAEWVSRPPRGEPLGFGLARLVESDGGRDEAENSYYEPAADPDFVRMERAQRRFRGRYLRRLRRLRRRDQCRLS